MIQATRSTIRSRHRQRNTVHSVWSEPNKRGGYTIYAGVRGTDIKTYAGSAMSKETLDYNLRKAKSKFNISEIH